MPRSFKVLVLALVLSNIGVGSFAFYSLRALDRKYSALLARAVPTLNDLQTLTARTVEAMRTTNPSVLGTPPIDREKLQQAREAIATDQELRRSLLQRHWLSAKATEPVEFERAGDEFTRAATNYLEKVTSLPAPDAARQREETLRPPFERYLIATTKYADAIEADSLQSSDAITLETSSLARMLLALGNWPIIIVFLLLVLSVGMLIFAIRTSLFVDKERWQS